jgi:predicted membrane metal-binding protein
MPTSVALAIAISAGVAAGVFLDSSLLSLARWVLAVAGGGAFVTAARGWKAVAQSLSLAALAAACMLLAADAEHRAMQPPIRQLLDERLGGFDITRIDTERNDTPVVIEGRLTDDATVSESGATLRLEVERAWLGPCPEPASGGVSLSVSGAFAAESVNAWRAGRRIRAPAILRRPARYLNHGVPDHERLLARRGVALVGNIKSAALVQVLANGGWIDETASAIRWRVRNAIARQVGSIDPQSAAVAIAILIGDRGSLDPEVERRLQEAGTYHVIAISGGNIAILAGLALAALWGVGARRMGGRRHGLPAGVVRLHRRRRAVRDSRHRDGRNLPAADGDRSTHRPQTRHRPDDRHRPAGQPAFDRRRRPVADIRRDRRHHRRRIAGAAAIGAVASCAGRARGRFAGG